MLLKFPVELIQLVLCHASTTSFMHLAYSCRTLYNIASTSRKVLLFHLRQTPGTPFDIASLGTQDLFRLLSYRIENQLYGIEFFSKSTTYTLEEPKIIDPPSTAFSSGNDSRIAVVAKSGAVVHVYRVDAGVPVLLRDISLPLDEPGTVRVHKTAFTKDNGVAVLFGILPTISDEGMQHGGPIHPFVRDAVNVPFQREFVVVIVPDSDPEARYTYILPIRADSEPLALCAYTNFRFAISWWPLDADGIPNVVAYSAEGKGEIESGYITGTY
jgi:hypothetical protein